MIPYKQSKGREAFKTLKVYVGVPNEFEGQETVQLPETIPRHIKKSVELGKISRLLGSKF
jgi:large subunit ribosomal protein L13